MKKKKNLEKICISNNGSKQIKLEPTDVVGICGYGQKLPCQHQTNYATKRDYFGCLFEKQEVIMKFPEGYFGGY